MKHANEARKIVDEMEAPKRAEMEAAIKAAAEKRQKRIKERPAKTKEWLDAVWPAIEKAAGECKRSIMVEYDRDAIDEDLMRQSLLDFEYRVEFIVRPVYEQYYDGEGMRDSSRVSHCSYWVAISW